MNTAPTPSPPRVQLVSTDFDGTIFAEFEQPPVPHELEEKLARLQAAGARWVINTGRDLGSLMEALGRARLRVHPDFLVLVEREIYRHDGVRYLGVESWNERCAQDQERLFAQVRPEVPRLAEWISARYDAAVYSDAYSPFCLIANSNSDADAILAHLEEFCRQVPDLTVVRNDVYARFSHRAYSKGTALREISRLLAIQPAQVFAAGDHLNDLPMLCRDHAAFLACPANAIPSVRDAVRAQGGIVGERPHGYGISDALQSFFPEALAPCSAPG